MPTAAQAPVFGLPNPPLARYGYLVQAAGPVDLWPCNDAIGSTALANAIPGRVSLATFAGNVLCGAESLLTDDPNGTSVQLIVGRAYTAGVYTMPAAGTMEVVVLALPIGNGQAIIGNWNGSGIMLYSDATLNLIMYMNGGPVTYITTQADHAPSPMHLAVTWNGTTQILYVNGIARTSQAAAAPNAAGAFGFGQYSSGSGVTSNGRYQWAAIYSRVLSADEIASHARLAV